jgi:hypothetical protein
MKSLPAMAFLSLMAMPFLLHAQHQSESSSLKKQAPWFVDRFRVTGGFFVPVSNTDMQVDIDGQVAGTEIDVEEDLGMDNTQLTFLSSLQWRISKRSRLNFMYYNIPRNSTHTLGRDIDFNGNTYPINTTVKSNFNTAIYQISYGYAVLSKPNYEVGVLIGTHLVGAEAGIALEAGNGNIGGSTNFGFTAPLPDLGLWGGVAITDRVAVTFDVDYLSMTIDNITGSIFAYNLLFAYNVVGRLDLTAGFSGLNFNLGVEKKNANASFKWAYNGPALGLTYAFGKNNWK